MSDYDLSGLMAVAKRVGLLVEAVRVVPPDPRRGAWFRWTDRELLVNERVLERLGPAEADVLLVHAVFEARKLDAARRRVAVFMAMAVALACALWWVSPFLHVAAGLVVVVTALGCVAGWARARHVADDEAVRFLGDAEVLVRALNTIHQDELHIAGKKLNVRPDIHERAERLVKLHQLRVAPEQRTCAPIPASCDPSGERVGERAS